MQVQSESWVLQPIPVVRRQAAWSGRGRGLLGEEAELRFSWVPGGVDQKPSSTVSTGPLPPGPGFLGAHVADGDRQKAGSRGVGGWGWVNAATL